MTAWRKSSYSDGQGACVELAEAGERVWVRNSNRPDAGQLDLGRTALAGWIAGCRSGEFDDLV